MFMNDVNKKEEIRNIALKHLRKYGIKHRGKTTRQTGQIVKSKKLFHVPLQNLENETVTLRNGQQLVVPKRLNEMCSFILSKADTEGLFRKEGSKSRQNVIKLSLDRGCLLGNEHHVIDVAVVLKCFLRELPEPLIPYSFHELFVRCSLIEKNIEAILLACLLLPTEHLNVLSYLMQFLNEVANQAKYNKMTAYNLSLLLGPNVFPINEKMAPKNKLMVKKICDITKLMIDHSKNIGLIPDYIIEQIGNFKSGELEAASEKVKRRRSGSLTRIFNGLKKIVGTKVDDDNLTAVTTVTPDLLLTPSVCLSKKRFPSHKPDKNQRTKDDCSNSNNNQSNKQNALERRWSAITSSATNLRKKKRDSFIYRPNNNTTTNAIDNSSNCSSFNSSRADYVRVSKSEYEDIKNRVSAIEKRLSLELENATSNPTTVISNEVNIVHDIQSAYEQTLVQTEPLHHVGSDRFVRRLSKELRIRNSDQKLIRSPSARKIGNIRRRSKERSIERQPAAKKLTHSPSMKQQQTRSVAAPIRRSASATSSSSSPITTSISLKTNINNLNANTLISFRSSPGSSFDFTSSMEYSNIAGEGSSKQHLNIHPQSSPRRGIKRNAANVSPQRRGGLKQRYCDIDGHRLIEITPSTPDHNINDKENGFDIQDATKTIPRIKRPMQMVSKTPKRTPKSNNRVNTPLRVLPSTLFNIPDF